VKFYIATGFENKVEHNRVRDLLISDGHEITYDWTIMEAGVTDFPIQRAIAKAEIQGVIDADFLIVLLPGKFGTHAELGAALALDKPVILCGEMVGECIFHAHPHVMRIPRFDDLNKIWKTEPHQHVSGESKIVGDAEFNMQRKIRSWDVPSKKDDSPYLSALLSEDDLPPDSP
jgi:nucleoside 2-deoxyribosyltransferase